MRKRIISVLLILVTVMSAFFVCEIPSGALTRGVFVYNVLQDGSIELTDYWCVRDQTELSIPSIIDGYRVTRLDLRLYDDDSLVSISIPASVSYISPNRFDRCKSLNTITVSEGNTVYDSRGGCNAIIETATDTLIVGSGRTTIPSSVTSIGANAFEGRSSLISISIPASVASIGERAFSKCDGLKSIYISDGLTSIGEYAFYECTGLTGVSLPDSITSIGECAFMSCGLKQVMISHSIQKIEYGVFYGCSSLKRVTIPDSVIYIGSSAFDSCESLVSVDIPNSVVRIDCLAFCNCAKLNKVIIPKSVRVIEGNIFRRCPSLEIIRVDSNNKTYDSRNNCNAIINTAYNALITGCQRTIIPETVTRISSSAFLECTSLTNIYIPDSVTNIDTNAFDACSGLTDVYYQGSKEEWDMIDIDTSYGNHFLINAALHFNASPPDNDRRYYLGKMYFDKKVLEGVYIEFNSDWFFNDSKDYNHEIAKLSSQMILEGYTSEDNEMNGVESDFMDSLESIGFQKGKIDYNLNTGRDEMNYFIASKPIRKDNEKYNLVYVGCIGSWHEQWNSNFDPFGTESSASYSDTRYLIGTNHVGFNDAKNYMYLKLKEYLNDYGYQKENTKILLTGHSRGAATANLLGAKLIDDLDLIKPENLFTYTFATPNCTSNVDRKTGQAFSKYNRIYNIVYPNDFVTKVLPSAWGFGRYGKTYSLPTKTNDKDWTNRSYNRLRNKMMPYYVKLNNATSDTTDFNEYLKGEADVYSVVTTFSTCVSGLYDFYHQHYRFNRVEYKTPFLYFQSALCPVVNHTKTKYGDETSGYANLATPLVDGGILFRSVSSFFAYNQGVTGRFADAHKMETYCAFMLGLSEEEVTAPRKGFLGSVNCPVDIEIVDKDSSEIVGRIVNNIVDEEIEANDNAVVMTVDGDEKQYWLPYNGNYEVRLIGNDNGVMDYTLSEIDPDFGETGRKNYLDVELKKDSMYTCAAGEDVQVDESTLTDFTLTDTAGDEIAADEVMTSDETVEYNVCTNSIGSGIVDKSIRVKSGDYVTVCASPYKGSFIGWYQKDKLVSEDEEYRFRPEDNVIITAKFTRATPETLGDVDGDGDIVVRDVTYLERKLVSIEIPFDFVVTPSDADGDGEVTLMDATFIQRWIANLNSNNNIGKPIVQ
nr:leucine-rich repeat protein [uncultured Ruminococcus sp.]